MLVELEKSLRTQAVCSMCDGDGEVEHSCDCALCTEDYEDCPGCGGSGKAKWADGLYPREISSDDGDGFGSELEPYILAGWSIYVRDSNGTQFATAERYHKGRHQFVQERAVYLADLIERIKAAMDAV